MQYHVEIKRTGKKGRGVFALKNFEAGKIIESCPVLVFDTKGRKNLEKNSA